LLFIQQNLRGLGEHVAKMGGRTVHSVSVGNCLGHGGGDERILLKGILWKWGWELDETGPGSSLVAKFCGRGVV
jgi:hypothetical protein